MRRRAQAQELQKPTQPPSAPPTMSALSSHRYRHLYPPTSLFHRSAECRQQDHGQSADEQQSEQRRRLPACGSMVCAAPDAAPSFRAVVPVDPDSSNFALVWSIVRAARMREDDAHTAAQTDTHALYAQHATITAKIDRRPEEANNTLRMHEVESAVAEATDAPAAASSPAVAVLSPPAAAAAASAPPAATEIGVYTRDQLLSLYRPSGVPAVLQSRLDSSDAATGCPVESWLATCISAESQSPLALCATPHPAESALRAELARDAEMTGVAEYAQEWWLPNYSAMNSAAGGGGGRRGGRGGSSQYNGGGKRGRGGGGRGGRGGYQNNNWGATQAGSNKKRPQTTSAAAAESNAVEAVGQSMDQESSAVVAPAAASVAAQPVVAAPTPALGAGFGLGAGRKPKGGKKRAHDESAAPTKNLYAQTNISRMFIGPAGPPTIGGAAAAAAAPSASVAAPAQSAAAMQFVLPSGSPPSIAALPASVSSSPAASSSSSLPPLPSKQSLFEAGAAASASHSDPVANEMMRNIIRHQQEQQKIKDHNGANTDGVAHTKE